MDRLIPESTYDRRSDRIYTYLDSQGYGSLVATARTGHYSKYYAWYLASVDSRSPLYESIEPPPSSMSMFYNGLFWYRVYLIVQESLDGYSDGDNQMFNEMISNPPEMPDADLLSEIFDSAETTANRYMARK